MIDMMFTGNLDAAARSRSEQLLVAIFQVAKSLMHPTLLG
jgi:hypothetical protein